MLEESSAGGYRGPTAGKTNKWAVEQREPGTLLEANTTKLKLFGSRHIMRRQDSLGKTMPGKHKAAGKEEGQL